MPIDRPTFHEAWYRVADLRPRLLSAVRTYRQHYRGQLWYVLENAADNQYSRISSDAYAFIGLLDGRRTVSEAWEICNEQLGDQSPTQGEVLQILGQLHQGNLLYADLPPDTEMLFRRHRKRVNRQVQGFMMNLLFIRIPLFDPDPILEQWVGAAGGLFSWVGFLAWAILVGLGLSVVLSNAGDLVAASQDILAPKNLVYLYLTMVFIKAIHEFGHAMACKRFGQFHQGGGPVHTMGLMFLVFMPLPYVDVSSAWTFRSRWHRAMVGLAGVASELALAAIAVLIWVNTSNGVTHTIAYNVIFIASVSTLLFNGNPLLRYDAYYVLSDLVEIPNLAQRAKEYISYLFKRYTWGLDQARNPAGTLGERIWFVGYGISSAIYRVFISIHILLFLGDRLPSELSILVPFLATGAVVAWLIVPAGKLIRLLATGPELARHRLRAVGATLAISIAVLVGVGLVRVADYWRVEGIVEPNGLAIVYAEADGFVDEVLPSGQVVTPGAALLVAARNPQLDANRKGLHAELRGLEVRRRMAETEEMAAAQIMDRQIQALNEKVARVDSELASLRIHPSLAGTWVAPGIENTLGTFLHRGQEIGLVGTLEDMAIRATASQDLAAMLIKQARPDADVRVKGRPDISFPGRIVKIAPAGQNRLPSKALGYLAGGSAAVSPDDPTGTKAAERVFEIKIKPTIREGQRLWTGQRVIARIRMQDKTLLAQGLIRLRQLFQKRYHI